MFLIFGATHFISSQNVRSHRHQNKHCHVVPTEDKYLPPDRRAGTAIHMNAPGNPAILALQL
jgi:hypothetical protein